MRDSPGTLTTDLGLLALAGIWGVNFSVVKIVLEELDPLALNALRFPLAVLALGVVLRGSPGPSLPRREDMLRIVVLGVLGNVAYQLCFIYGIENGRSLAKENLSLVHECFVRVRVKEVASYRIALF